jgi:hypothetical protein
MTTPSFREIFGSTRAVVTEPITPEGVPLGIMFAPDADDHPAMAHLLTRAGELAERVAAFRRAVRTIFADGDAFTWKGRQDQAAVLAAQEIAILEDRFGNTLKVARNDAGHLEFGVLRPKVGTGDTSDPASVSRAIEIRERFGRLDQTEQLERVRLAIHDGRGDAKEFLRALLADNAMLSPLPERIRDVAAQALLEQADPAVYHRWRRLTAQIDGFAGVLEAAKQYMVSTADLGAAQLAERQRDEETRARLVRGGTGVVSATEQDDNATIRARFTRPNPE